MALLQSRVANLFLVLLVVGTVGCAAKAKLRVADGTGPQPVLPQPDRSLVPRIDVVDAKGRRVYAGAEVRVFAAGTRRLISSGLVDAGGGYCAQNTMPVHVSTGEASRVDIEVTTMSTRGRQHTSVRHVSAAARSSSLVRVSVSRP